MRLSLVITLFSLMPSVVLATPSRGFFRVKERVHAPRGWFEQPSPPAEDHTITLRIGLPQANFHDLEKHLLEVSDPYHERYGDHLSKEEVEALVAPHPSSIEAVDTWLASHGLAESDLVRSPAKDWVVLNLPVKTVEKMLDTKYSVWKHAASGDTLLRTTSEELHEHVDVIQPTTMFARLRSAKSTLVWGPDEEVDSASRIASTPQTGNGETVIVDGLEVDVSCNTTITIRCLQQIYNATGYTPSKDTKSSIGIAGYLEEYANIEDLQSFYKEQRPDALNSSFSFVGIKGGINPQNLSLSGAEAALDVQFGFGLSYPIPGTYYQTAGRPPFIPDNRTVTNTNEPYVEWIDAVLSLPSSSLPLSITTSYGDDEQTVPRSYALRACAGFAQLGARGVSVIFSSGDWGVGDNVGPEGADRHQCWTNDGTNRRRFIPVFPASCPYVTAVGGTQGIPEVAVSRFGSGGGFSDYFPRPFYQGPAVQRYLDALPKGLYESLYNPRGRAFPDISTQGDRYRIFLRGAPRSIGGTSASAPTFAALVALLNDARLAAGRRPLGFLNPLLYSSRVSGVARGDDGALNDVVVGNNPGCGTLGFNATKGWDPVTGLGTPNFGKLKDIVLA